MSWYLKGCSRCGGDLYDEPQFDSDLKIFGPRLKCLQCSRSFPGRSRASLPGVVLSAEDTGFGRPKGVIL